MILDDYKNNDYNEINLFKLSEETIRIVNQLLTNLDDKGTLQEYYSYIDQLINYFNHKKNVLLNFSRNKIDSIYNIKRIMINKLSDNDKINYNMLRIPDKSFSRIPYYSVIDKDDFIEKWDFENNDEFQTFSNVYSDKYKKIIKSLTNGKCSKFSDIENLIDKISDYEKVFNNKEDTKKYLDKLIIPQEDIKRINSFIDRYVNSLNNLKNISIIDLDKKSSYKDNLISAIKMVEIKTSYVKCVINILFKIYLSKLKLFNPNINVEDNENVLIDESVLFIFNETDELLEEAYVLENFGYDTEKFKAVKNRYIEIKGNRIDALKIYIEELYKSAIKHIDKYYNLDALKYLDFFDLRNKEFLLTKIDSIKDVDRFIENKKNYNLMRLSQVNDYVDLNGERTILKEYLRNKDKIKRYLDYDYRVINEYIDSLKLNKEKDYSKLFERNYRNLSLFANSEIETLENKIESLGFKIPYKDIVYNNEHYGKLIKEINEKYDKPQKIIEILDRYLLLVRQSDQVLSYLNNPISIKLDNLNDFPNSNKLLAYLIYFQNKCLDIGIF